jgi:Major intrinsic protein
MKFQQISCWLCLIPWTITFGLHCAAISEAFLETISLQHVHVSRINKHKIDCVTTNNPLRQRMRMRPSLTGNLGDDLSSLRGGAVEDAEVGITKTPDKPLFRELLAEVIGTFLIVQIGTGSVMSAIFTDSLVGLFQIASVWIIAVTIAICTTASISGAHLNPAISVRLTWKVS